jgi:hypothetical protein
VTTHLVAYQPSQPSPDGVSESWSANVWAASSRRPLRLSVWQAQLLPVGNPAGWWRCRRGGRVLGASALPQSCQDLVEVVADAGRPLRAAQIAAAAGLSTDQARVAGLRSQCAGRGRPGQPLLCLRELLRSCWRWPSLLPSATWTRRTPRCPLTRWYPVRPRRVCSCPQDPWVAPVLN